MQRDDGTHQTAVRSFRLGRQFTLRALFLSFIVISILFGAVVHLRRKSALQAEAVVSLRNHGAIILYDYEIDQNGALTGSHPGGPKWLRQVIGEDAFRSVHSVSFMHGHHIDGRVLEEFRFLRNVQEIDLQQSTVTDKGLTYLRAHRSLRALNLGNTQITDIGLDSLSSLDKLQWLDLRNTAISDRGLATLARFQDLVTLNLSGTQVTGQGIRQLVQCSRLEFLFVGHTAVDGDSATWFKQQKPACHVVYE